MMLCPATAYRPELAPTLFHCSLPLNHDGDHESHPEPDTTVGWPSDIKFRITTMPGHPKQPPADDDEITGTPGVLLSLPVSAAGLRGYAEILEMTARMMGIEGGEAVILESRNPGRILLRWEVQP